MSDPANTPAGEAGRGISAVLISFNEEKRIRECLESLRWADEIVVVDSGSSDATRDIARSYTDRVYEIPWQGFGPQKQAAVERATHRWVLNVDCDERVTESLAAEIRRCVRAEDGPPAWSIPRKTYIGKKWIRHSGWYPDPTIRLFDRTKARFSPSLVHERVLVDGDAGQCSGHLLHYSFESVADLFRKIPQYSDASARQMFESGREGGRMDLLLRPALAFLKSYALKLGVLDGREGLAIAASTFTAVRRKYAVLRQLRQAARREGTHERS